MQTAIRRFNEVNNIHLCPYLWQQYGKYINAKLEEIHLENIDYMVQGLVRYVDPSRKRLF